MRKLNRSKLVFALTAGVLLVAGCGPSDEETNVYQKEHRYPGAINAPVAFLVAEWGGLPRVMASGWLVNKEKAMFLTAKHFTDVFMGDPIELGNRECRMFFNGHVYDCSVARVPPLRDASVLKISSFYDPKDFPEPYEIPTTLTKVKDIAHVQGLHPHPHMVSESNAEEGFPDLLFPIRELYYGVRMADPKKQMEISFDSLEAKVTAVGVHVPIDWKDKDNPTAEELLKFHANDYFQVKTKRNHKFSFGGLSGGVVVRIASDGRKEAVGIVTSERPVRMVYDSKKKMIAPDFGHIRVADTMAITPIASVKDLLDYIKYQR